MILPFSTKINDKPNYFVEKIWEGLLRNIYETDTEYQQFLRLHKIRFGEYWDWLPDEATRMTNPKIHTFREDKTSRWKEANLIHFFINNQSVNMFQFAPVLPVVSTQKIEIYYFNESAPNFTGQLSKMSKGNYNEVQVCIDDRVLSVSEIEVLALNDGFDTANDFFGYFKESFNGKIIHWTNFKY